MWAPQEVHGQRLSPMAVLPGKMRKPLLVMRCGPLLHVTGSLVGKERDVVLAPYGVGFVFIALVLRAAAREQCDGGEQEERAEHCQERLAVSSSR